MPAILKGEEVGKEHFGDICFIVLDSPAEWISTKRGRVIALRFRMVVKGVSDYAMQSRDSLVVKELLTTAENQRYIRFKNQARYKLR